MGQFYENTPRRFNPASHTNELSGRSWPALFKPDRVQNTMIQRIVWGRGQILSVAWSPDGQTLGVGASFGIALYDASTLEPERDLATDTPIDTLQFIDQASLLTVSGEMVAFQSLANAAATSVVITQMPASRAVAIAADSRYIALDCGGSIDIHLLDSGEHLISLPCIAMGFDESIAFTAESALVAVAVGDGVALWDLHERRLERVVPVEVATWGAAFIPRQPWIAAVGENILELRSVPDGSLVRMITCDRGPINRFAVSPNGRLVAIAAGELVQIWQLDDAVCTHTLPQRSDQIRRLAFSPDSRRLAIAGTNWLDVWSLVRGAVIATHDADTADSYWGNISNLAFSADGAAFITLGDTIAAWQLASERIVRCFPRLKSIGPASGIAIAPDNALIAIATDTCVAVYNWHAEQPLYTCEPGLGRSDGVAFCWARRELVVLGAEAVYVWDAWLGKLLQTFDKPAKSAAGMALSDDGTFEKPISSADDMALSMDGTTVATVHERYIRFWNIHYAELLEEIEVTYEVNSIALSAHGSLIAIASDEAIHVWHVERCKLLATLPGQAHRVYFAPNGRHLAATCDKTIALWDSEDAVRIATFVGHTEAINSLAFSPDGRLLTSASTDGTVRLWFSSP